MAENGNMDPKDAKDLDASLQSIASSLNLLAKTMKTFSTDMKKSADLTKSINSDSKVIKDYWSETTGFTDQASSYLNNLAFKNKDYLKSTKQINAFTKDLQRDNEQIERSLQVKNLAMATGMSLAQAELEVLKQEAIARALAEGSSARQIKKLEEKFNKAIELNMKNEELNDLQEEQERKAQQILEVEQNREKVLGSLTAKSNTLKDIITDQRVAAAYFANQMFKAYSTTSEIFSEARKEGLTVTQAFEDTTLAVTDYFSLSGASAKDSMEVMSAMREELGSIEEVTRSARLEAVSLAKTFGISNQEAAQLTAQLSTMPGATMDSANNTAEFAGNMAKAAGVAPGAVLKDMAKNSEAVATYGKDGGKNMAVMAVAAKKVGVEMGSMVNAAEQLLDFESSIEKQMEASVLLGREINLDKARQLALEGDLAGATKEMLANVGGEAEFNKMNAIQRKALADSMGVSVGELQKMVKNQDALTDLTQEQQEALAAGETTMDELAANASGFGSKMWEVGSTITSGVIGLGEMTNGLKEGVAAAKDLGKGLMNVVGGILPKMSASLKSMGGNLKDKFGGIKDKLSGAASKTAEASAAASKTPPGAGKSMGGLTKAIEKIKPGKLLAGAAALVLVAAAVFVFAKAAQEFAEVSWESIGKAIVAMLALVGALALVGMIMMSGVGAVAILAGAGAMLIMAAALFVLGKAIQEMAVGFNMFAPALMELAPMAMQIVALGAGLVLMGAGMLALGVASWFAAPGILYGSLAIGALAISMLLFGAAMNYAMPGIMMLTQLGSLAPAFGELAMAMWSLAAGITAFATAGLFTLPTIMGLIALSFVAPILTALGDSINYDLGGGNNTQQAPAENKMDILIEEIRQLRAAFQTPGTINMDGQKVGDVLGLAVSNSGIS